MKMYPNQDTFKFMQDHVIMNQPMRIVFRARETADVSYRILKIEHFNSTDIRFKDSRLRKRVISRFYEIRS